MNRLILVVGTPGVGKSELARGLGRKLHLDVVDLGVVVRQRKLYRRYDRRTRSYEIDERLVRSFVRESLAGRSLLLATHIIGNSIPVESVSQVFVLRLDPLVLARRLRKRKWPREKVWENVESELVDVCFVEAVREFGRKRVVELDTTEQTRSKVLSKALTAVRVKKRFSGSAVDWLSKYDPVELERNLRWKNSTS